MEAQQAVAVFFNIIDPNLEGSSKYKEIVLLVSDINAAAESEAAKKEKERLAVIERKKQAEAEKERERIANLEKENAEREEAIAYYDKFLTDYPYQMKHTSIVPYEKNGSWGFINSTGDAVVPFKYEFAAALGYGLVAVQLDNKLGVVNVEGKLITPIKYLHIKPFKEGMAAVKTNPYWGYINVGGEEVIEPGYLDAYNFVNGFAPVEEYTGEGIGFINKNGELVIPYDYESVGFFYEGLAKVKRKEKWGYINKKNEIIIPIKYEAAGNFLLGYTTVKTKSDSDISWGCIDWKGKQLTKWNRFEKETARKRVYHYNEPNLSNHYLSSTKDIRNANVSVEKQYHHLITIENVEIDRTRQQTILTLRFDLGYRSQILSAPGSKVVLYLQDENGKRYDLLNQSGWKGDKENGFGQMEFNGDPVDIKLYFEMLDSSNPSSFDVLTDNCDADSRMCWNFYGIQILDL